MPTHKSVLVVDDDELLLSAVSRALRKAPFYLETATNADEAMNLMRSESFHVVVSDNWMKGMNGTDFLAWVEKYYPNTARIVLTGHPELIDQPSITAYRLIGKPVSGERLAKEIQMAYQNRVEKIVDPRAPINWQSGDSSTDLLPGKTSMM